MFKSAIEAIELGVEDFSSDDPRRAASAVRSFYAGVLLLAKERLRRESEELLYERVVPSIGGAGVEWRAAGKATVSVQGIIERWNALGWKMKWGPLLSLRDLRNEVEHRGAGQEAVLRKAISDTFALVVVLLTQHLGESPAKVLDTDAWERMHSEANAYEALRRECVRSQKRIAGVPASVAGPAREALEAAVCPDCGSELLAAKEGDAYPDTVLECRSCARHTTPTEVISNLIREQIGFEEYEAATEGGSVMHGTCPCCGEDAFSLELDACLLCGEGRHYTECDRCLASLGLDEQETGLCGYCQHVWDKIERE